MEKRERMRRIGMGLAAAGAGAMLGGCVNITAPDKPIVINLNIRIEQEVVYRLDSRAKTVIQQNEEVF